MHATSKLVALMMIPLIAGCPSSSGDPEDPLAPINLTVTPDPIRTTVRRGESLRDAESVIWSKAFAESLGTTFDEALTALSIDVGGDCDADSTACETWTFSALGTAPGKYDVESFREITQPDGTIGRASGTVEVQVAPDGAGATRTATVVADNTATIVAANGRLWTQGQRGLFADFQAPWEDVYTATYLRESDADGLRAVSLIAGNDDNYLVAILDDDTAIVAGAALDGGARVFPPAPFVALNDVLAEVRNDSGAAPVQLVADTQAVDAFPSMLTAMRLSDGRVLAWYGEQTIDGSGAAPFTRTPAFVEGIESAVDLSIDDNFLLILLADGRVMAIGNPRSPGTDADVLQRPVQVDGLTGIIQLAARHALAGDGAVYTLPRTVNAGDVTQAIRVPGLNDASSLPSPHLPIAERADGSLAIWQLDGSGAPLGAEPLTFGAIGRPAVISRDLAVDSACGRLWRTSLGADLDAQAGTGAVRVTRLAPQPGSGGNVRCEAGDQSRIVYFLLNGSGSGTVSASSGNVECAASGDYCWWLGPNDGQPQFTAVPGSGSGFRDWRWDCASDSPVSGGVMQAQGTSQNLCKVTFVAGGETVAVDEWRLDPRSTGLGTIQVTPEPLRVDANGAFYADGTVVTLTALPDTGFVFGGWDADGCTNDTLSAEIMIVMDRDRVCTANFVRPAGGVAPVGRIQVSPGTVVAPGTLLTFDASTSTDADGTIVSWDWDFGNDMSIDASGEVVMASFSDVGITDVGLRVTDNDGLVGVSAVGITVQAAGGGGQTFTVQVVVSGDGQVLVNPLGRTLRDSECDGDECFIGGVASGTTLILTASPFTPAAFAGWDSMACDNIPDPNTCEITVFGDRSVTATFN